MKYEEDLKIWHEMIDPGNQSLNDRYKLMMDEIKEFDEAIYFGSKIKESCDVLVTAYAVIKYGGNNIKTNSAKHFYDSFKKYILGNDIEINEAMRKVFDSNMSKFVLEEELPNAINYFKELELDVYPKELGNGYFGFYSSLDQEANKKKYPKNKLLKSHKYKKIDESIDWWNQK